jgi:integrase
MQEVIAWCDRQETGVNKKYVVADCLADYYKAQALDRSPSSAAATQARLTHHATDALLNTEVRKLTTRQLTAWRDSMVATGDAETVRKSKDSANRTWSMMRAALNRAYKLDITESDKAWKKVTPFKQVSKARDLFLTDAQVTDLLAHTRGAFHAITKAAIFTGARYGELTAAKVSDLKADGILKLDGKTGARDVSLSHVAEAFFKQQAKSKLPDAPLLMSPDGEHWRAGQQRAPMISAVRAAKLPSETVFYSLRHYYISKAVLSGMSLLLIAQNCGTSVQMIQDHYGKFQPDDKRALMDLVELGGVK